MTETGDGWGADLMAGFRGGSPFLERLQKISDLRAAQEAALADLNLGKSAKAAQEAADASLAEAEQKMQSAAQLSASAALSVEQAKRDASQIRAEAEKALSDARAEAEVIIGNAKVEQEAAKSAKRRLDALIKKHEAAIAAANTAHEEANEVKTKFETKLAKFQQIALEITKLPNLVA